MEEIERTEKATLKKLAAKYDIQPIFNETPLKGLSVTDEFSYEAGLGKLSRKI